MFGKVKLWRTPACAVDAPTVWPVPVPGTLARMACRRMSAALRTSGSAVAGLRTTDA
jgi:hypothetical protein